MDGGEEACAQVMVQVLVLAHLEHFIPLLHRHLVLNALGCLLLIADLLPAKLNTPHNTPHYNPITGLCDEWLWSWDLTLGLVGATWQARKANLYESSRTPSAFRPRTPSFS